MTSIILKSVVSNLKKILNKSSLLLFYFSWRGIPYGAKSDALCYLNDIYLTLCNLLNLPAPKSVEAKSLSPIFKNKNAKIRDALFLAYKTFQRAIRTDDNWKLIQYQVKGKQTTQLFDLNNDPYEMNNLADRWEHKAKQEHLIELLTQNMKELGDVEFGVRKNLKE